MSSTFSILLVEDEDDIRNILKDALEAAGYKVMASSDGLSALSMVREYFFDLVLLDVGLPGADGFEVLSVINKEKKGVPVIMLTARGAEDDRINGLKLGADDYIVKPFSIRELFARIEAVLRRSPERPKESGKVKIPGASLDAENRILSFPNGQSVGLTGKEYELLLHMVNHPGRIVTRDELLRRVWEVDPRLVETRSVEMTIARLREKLGSVSPLLETLRGQGYRWNVSRKGKG